jgi:hypothetical protein
MRQLIFGPDMVFRLVFDLVAREGIPAGKPTPQIDIRATPRTKGPVFGIRVFLTDGADQQGRALFVQRGLGKGRTFLSQMESEFSLSPSG